MPNLKSGAFFFTPYRSVQHTCSKSYHHHPHGSESLAIILTEWEVSSWETEDIRTFCILINLTV